MPGMMEQRSEELDGSEEGRAFLQYRVARFGLVCAVVCGASLVFRVVGLAVNDPAALSSARVILHGVAALAFLGIWLLLRAGQRSARFVRSTESLGLFAAVIATALMGVATEARERPDVVVLLGLVITIFARAVYVPSSGRRTLWLGIALAPPLLIGNFVCFMGASPEAVAVFAPGMSVRAFAGRVTIQMGVWWAVSVGVTTLASGVLYGLRRAVRDAQKLGQYHLAEELGRGAMGVVYRATHALLRRPTAIKMLDPERTGAEAIARFEKEVCLTARLTHPNTITVFDYGRTPDGVFYYAMELLRGATLEAVVAADGPQPAGRVVKVLAEAASALAEAHAIGLIHRDIKPANLMLCEHGGLRDVTKLLDFGLVRHVGPEADLSATEQGIVMGTPYYMAPEAFRGAEEVDASSDLYGLGAVGYFMLTGEPPFTADSFVGICTKHLTEVPVPPSERLGRPVDEDLEALVLACLAKDPKDRPASAVELAERLRSCRCAGSWTAEDARGWWGAHDATHPVAVGDADTVVHSMVVDLARRD